MVPPEGFARLAQQPIDILLATSIRTPGTTRSLESSGPQCASSESPAFGYGTSSCGRRSASRAFSGLFIQAIS